MQLALQAIAEPRRRQILEVVRDHELPAGEIASRFPEVSRPAISQHLGVLREAGLVTERRQGTSRLYLARPEGLAEVREFVATFWDSRLDVLQTVVENATKQDEKEAEEYR